MEKLKTMQMPSKYTFFMFFQLFFVYHMWKL